MLYVGYDIGGTKCAVVLGRTEGSEITILDKVRFPTAEHPDYRTTLRVMGDVTETLLSKNGIGLPDIAGIGISCGGPLDSRRGVILSPPNLPGWDNVEIVRYYKQRFSVKTTLQNDANACAVAEWKFGAGRGTQNMIFLTFGTGMGAGLILDGRLYSGTSDLAGEVGHLRLAPMGPVGFGKAGSFEGFCSGGGLAQLAQSMVLERLQMGESVSFCPDIAHLSALNAKVVADAADAGDELAREIYRVSGEYLGRGLSLLIDILNPEVIVIGSVYARSENLLGEPAHRMVEGEALHLSRKVCRIVPAGLGERIGDIAALSVAML